MFPEKWPMSTETHTVHCIGMYIALDRETHWHHTPYMWISTRTHTLHSLLVSSRALSPLNPPDGRGWDTQEKGQTLRLLVFNNHGKHASRPSNAHSSSTSSGNENECGCWFFICGEDFKWSDTEPHGIFLYSTSKRACFICVDWHLH